MPTQNPTGFVPWVVNNFALPCLTKTTCGKGCTAVGACVWLSCDACCGNDNRPPNRPDTKADALVIFASVVVKDVDAYKKAFATRAEYVQKVTPGVRTMFSFMDKDSKENAALQIYWYDSPAVFRAIPKDYLDALTATYAESPNSFAAVFGGWTEQFKSELQATMPGVKIEYGKDGRGFLRDMSTYGPGGTPYKKDPMIWISKRKVKAGHMPLQASSFIKAGYLQYYAAPAFYGSYEFTASDDPDMLWSLRFFGDYHDGHINHFPKVICSWIPARVLFTVLPGLAGSGIGGFPIGVSFNTQDDINAAINWNPGNGTYTQYLWESSDLIGPKPNFMER